MKTTPSFDLVPSLGECLYLDAKIIVQCVKKTHLLCLLVMSKIVLLKNYSISATNRTKRKKN